MAYEDWEGKRLRFRRIAAADWDDALCAACQRPEITDLGIGYGPPPAAAALKELLFDDGDTMLWWVGPRQGASPLGLALLSAYTGELQSAVVLDAGWDSALMAAGLADLAALAFRADPRRTLVWTHLPLPEPEEARGVMVRLGYEVGQRLVGPAAAPCATYVLQRAVFAAAD